ncbi:MAG: hypothetical protein JWN23_1393 [Rhodocyclales bacterium]|nr:hypothetical protein [Rhodocyclales bacterium]
MTLYTELSASAQAAYAQVFDSALALEHQRSLAGLQGSFASKLVKGRKYWYFQFTGTDLRSNQIYVGADSETLRALIAEHEAGKTGNPSALAPLVRSAIALGNASVIPRHYRVLRRLADFGFFAAGGLLVGTHAFLAYGNMLGVSWGDSTRTQDIDFAHAGKKVSLALPSNLQVNTHDAIESLKMGFLPAQGLASYVNPKEPDFRIDFLTTLHRGGDAPFEHPQLKVSLQPLRFMEFSLEQTEQAALFANEGAVVVNLPSPVRYALHKILVAGERSGSFATKSSKDLQQSSALLTALREQRPHEVKEAWQDLLSRGAGWRSRAQEGIARLKRQSPDIVEWLLNG